MCRDFWNDQTRLVVTSNQNIYQGWGHLTKEVVTPSVNAQPDTKLCPECGAAMQIKNGRRGKFWGCTNFPRCHHTEDWNGD